MANPLLCAVPYCGNLVLVKSRGLCNTHYLRWRKYGDPIKTVKATNGTLRNFYYDVVRRYDGDECLIWPHSLSHGYAVMTINGQRVTVSRFLCEDVNGPPPTPKHEAAHSCGKGNLGCVTKGHLSWKTSKENKQDKLDHGTVNNGERNGMSKLTEAQAREILALKGKESQPSIAKRFGVAQASVSKIHLRKSWSWL